jgi:hypothetical protein
VNVLAGAGRFACNGPVETVSHCFFCPPREDELEKLMEAVDDRDLVMLFGPRQSGKTTLLYAIRERLLAAGQSCLYITLENLEFRVAAGVGKSWEAINRQLAVEADLDATADIGDLTQSNWLSLAVSKGLLTPPTVLIDEADTLHSTPAEVRDDILHGLRALATRPFDRRPARGIVMCGGFRVTTLATTPCEYTSPFNAVKTKVGMSRFTVPDLRALFNSYAELATPVAVDDDVVADIVRETGGHKGWCQVAGTCIQQHVDEQRKSTGVACDALGVSMPEWEIIKASRFEHAIMACFQPAVAFVKGGRAVPVIRALHAVAQRSRTTLRCYYVNGTSDDLSTVCETLAGFGAVASDDGDRAAAGAPLLVNLLLRVAHAV